MKNSICSSLQSQNGAASLFTALILLVCITLVTLLTSKTVLTEVQIAADNYRAAQSSAAANYAMDFGVNYFNMGGFDQDGTAGVDYNGTNITNLTSTDGSQTTTAQLTFNNSVGSLCVPADSTATMGKGMITARGFSDDGLASRTITQCVGPLGLLNGEGPDQPLVARGSVGLTGNARIINRYTNTTVWSGNSVSIGSSSSMETYIRDPDVGALTLAQLTEVPSTGAGAPSNTVLVSNRNLGNGLDIIDNDPSLGSLVGLEFFKNFFNVTSRDQVRQLATSIGQAYTSISSAITTPVKSGLIWIDGDQHWTGGTIGSLTKPAIVVINGDLATSGGSATVYGLLYIAGKWTVSGTPQIVGSTIVEGTNLSTNLPATPPIVTGTGSATVVFWPGFGSNSDNPIAGTTAVIAGSWRDW
jgi:Tfp pilus assembly protein PilX